MRLQIIGCYAATPRRMSRPSAQVLEVGSSLLLIDCGEGTQMELRRLRIRFSRIEHIFISHLHGDHFFGLPGLVATFRLMGRERPLHIYGPAGIKQAITLMLRVGDSWTQYPLHFHELQGFESELLLDNHHFQVETLPLSHRIYANGFLVREKPGERRLRVEAARKYGVDRAYFRKVKQGGDAPGRDGSSIPNELLTDPPPEPNSYAYCSDTAYEPGLVPLLQGVNTLYHEATFLETEAHLARKTGHSTAAEAARIARDASVGQLILGHYSTRYKSLHAFREEAAAIFPNTLLAEDGKVFQW